MILCLLVDHPSVIVGFAHKLGTTERLNQHFFSGDLAKHWNMMISHFTMGIQGFLMDLATPQICLTSHWCFPLQRHGLTTSTAGRS